MLSLNCHPDTPAKTIQIVQVFFSASQTGCRLEFHVRPSASLHLPAPAKPRRLDGLWRTTCFELFAKPVGGDGYYEFNFSPSFEWAAYGFDGYRKGIQELPSNDPEICTRLGDDFFLSVEAMPDLPPVAMKLGLSAVIEEMDGTKSYWALAHPPGPPDFHHPDCFVLDLPAPEHS